MLVAFLQYFLNPLNNFLFLTYLKIFKFCSEKFLPACAAVDCSGVNHLPSILRYSIKVRRNFTPMKNSENRGGKRAEK
jgi:hypothetical protein